MYKRPERVGRLLREEISKIIQREIKNPNMGFITITEVKLTNDLRQAKVYYSVYGSEESRKETTNILKNASSFIRSQIGNKVRLKYTPYIEFLYDQVPEHAAHIEKLLQKISKKRK